MKYDFFILSQGNSEKMPVFRPRSLTDYLPIISSDATPSIEKKIGGTWAGENFSQPQGPLHAWAVFPDLPKSSLSAYGNSRWLVKHAVLCK